ncbi:MAG: tetratricopeptide repeat protein [Spirochaetales bacterium]|nr:tetratricopeptide repeat protein [Spirochaetales bacterium]
MKRIKTAGLLFFLFLPSLLFSLDREAIELYQEGRQSLVLQDYYGAIDSLQEALRLNPAYLDAILALADAYFRIEEYDEAYLFIEKASLYGRNDISLINMKARILVGREDLDEGETLFREVLREEPNNLEANLGIAEISLLRGDRKKGEEQYRRSLILAPESRRALLSLALLYDREGYPKEAEKYLDLALTYHSRDPEVYIALAEHYLRTGDVDRASYFAQNGSLIAPESTGPFMLLGQAFMEKEEWQAAVDPLVNALSREPMNVTLLYMLSQCYIHLSLDKAALKTLNKALRIEPDNEIVRISMEQFLINNPFTSAEERAELSLYHLEKGRDFEDSLYFEKAFTEYRRSRWIDPYDWEGWLMYGRIFSRLGFPGKYLDNLQAMKENGYEEEDFLEKLRIMEHRKEKDLGDKWGLDQYDQVGHPYDISLFSHYSNQLVHTGSEMVVSDYLKYILLRYATINPLMGERIRTFSQAFSAARSQGSDYFVILDFSETERTFLCRAELYLTSTGSKILETSVMRTGKNRIALAMEKLASDLEASLIPRTLVLDLEDDEAILGLGRYHRLEQGREALLFKKDSVRLITGEEGIEYNDEDLLARVVLTEVDEEISLAVIERFALFDLISRWDEVYFLPVEEEGSEEQAEEEQNFFIEDESPVDSELKSQLLKLN